MAQVVPTSAEIIVKSANSEETIKVQFNPSEYSISRSSGFTKAHGIAAAAAADKETNSNEGLYLSSAADSTFRAKLTLDGFAKKGTTLEKDAEDIANDVKKIKALVLVDETLHRPPTCTFHWGSLFFRGYVTNVEEHYLMFSAEGKLLRATIDLTMREIDPYKLSLESPDRSKRRLVIESTQISLLAEEAYHDPTLWRPIAEANNLNNPRRLKPGRALVIPPLVPET
jgi:nucleoid-associated protein YgaU